MQSSFPNCCLDSAGSAFVWFVSKSSHWKANCPCGLVRHMDSWYHGIHCDKQSQEISSRYCEEFTALSPNTHLIFLRRILFSLSLFFNALMNWVKNSSWSLLFRTCLNRGSIPYFSENPLNVDLRKRTSEWDPWQSSDVFRHQCDGPLLFSCKLSYWDCFHG